jgi:hypothetical protein
MSNRLNELFKKKLENHTLEPSAEAWKRIQSGSSKKNRGIVVFRMAAVILLVGALITTTLWLIYKPQSHETTAELKTKASDSLNKKPSQPAAVAEHKTSSSAQQKNKASRKAPTIKTNQKVQPTPLQLVTVPIDSVSKKIIVESTGKPQEVAVNHPQEKTIVLEYRLEPVKPQQAQPEPALAAHEKSRIQKVIDFARDTKNGEGPINFRETKNEIFALNFKKDKKNLK